MSSTTLPSQSLPSARPQATGSAARALLEAITGFVALGRSASASRLRAMRQAAETKELRELALRHLATSPSFAADLLAAAGQLENVDERA